MKHTGTKKNTKGFLGLVERVREKELWDDFKKVNLHVMEGSTGRVDKIYSKNVQMLMENMNHHIHKAQQKASTGAYHNQTL
jgi:hypothetical protein